MSSGNYSVAGNLTISGNVVLGGSLLTQPFTTGAFGNVLIQGGADSTNLFTGALQIIGGAAFTGNSYVGGNIRTTNTAHATSAVTGAIICGGGVGVTGNVYTGGNIGITNSAAASSTSTGALIVSGGAGVAGNLYLGSNLVFSNTNVASYVPTPLSYYEELTYTMTWQWASSTNTSTVLITRIGRIITITFNSAITVGTGGVANPGGFACYSQNFPARFAPTTGVNIACPMPINNGSAYVMGCASINTNPTIYLNTGLYHGSGSGTAGAGTIIIGNDTHIYSITYTLF